MFKNYFAFIISFAICLLIILTKRWQKNITLDQTAGIQKFHIEPTPRVGGLGVFIGVIFVYINYYSENKYILGPLIIAGSIPFALGLAEDLTKRVSVSKRLIATILAAVVGWAVTGVSLTHIGVYFLDPLFKYQGFSLLFTAIAIGGVSNAINVIDGLNGLASSMLMVALGTVSLIAYSVGDQSLALSTLVISTAIFGFFLLNWPWGKIFLGDGGAYFCGFALSWSCVLLVERNLTISPFCCLLVCIYPCTEILFSVYRRNKRSNITTRPDSYHMHSLIYRRYLKTKKQSIYENSIAGIALGLLNFLPAMCAYYFKEDNLICIILNLTFVVMYLLIYRRVVKFKWL